jgi:hypothetical protein
MHACSQKSWTEEMTLVICKKMGEWRDDRDRWSQKGRSVLPVCLGMLPNLMQLWLAELAMF